MLAYKIRGNRAVEYFKDDDRVASGNASWNNADLIFV